MIAMIFRFLSITEVKFAEIVLKIVFPTNIERAKRVFLNITERCCGGFRKECNITRYSP